MAATIYDSRPASWLNHLQEAISYRSCLYWLVYRETRMRYRHAVLGLAWALIQPLASVLILAGFFQKVSGMESSGESYSLFSACGIIPWLYFSKAVASGAQSFLSHADIVKRNFFPRVFVPLTYASAHLIDLFIGLLAMVVWFGWCGRILTLPGLGLVLGATFWIFLLSFAISMILAPIQVRFRDIAYATTFALQGLFFVSPILYSGDNAHGIWKWMLILNPLSAVVGLYRMAFLLVPVDPWTLASGLVVTLVLLVSGMFFFMRVESSLSDRL